MAEEFAGMATEYLATTQETAVVVFEAAVCVGIPGDNCGLF